VAIRVTEDGVRRVTEDDVLRVTEDHGGTAPVITSTVPPDGYVGYAYSYQLEATGDEPITWALDSGALPDGLTLDPDTGIISGTPTTPEATSPVVEATNDTGSDTQALAMTIHDVSGNVNGSGRYGRRLLITRGRGA
jgi:hypothetical protein